MQDVTEQPIKKIIFLNFPEPLLATNRWPKRLRTLGTRLLCLILVEEPMIFWSAFVKTVGPLEREWVCICVVSYGFLSGAHVSSFR